MLGERDGGRGERRNFSDRSRRQDRMGRRDGGERRAFSDEEQQNWKDYKGREGRDKRREESKTEKALSGDSDWEIFSKMSAGTQETSKEPEVEVGSNEADEDAFFADLMKELNDSLDDPVEPETKEVSPTQSEGGGDLSKMTVPKLKEICRNKGLKVGGTKAELLERLQEH
jgi:hypothetical protein